MITISFITCVNDFEKYNACVKGSLREEEASGLIELIAVDNTLNQLSIPRALNCGIKKARADLFVCCHQDVEFPAGWVLEVLAQISVVEEITKEWGVLGTFGVSFNGLLVGNIIDKGIHYMSGVLPCRVQSLDEHCLILNRRQGLCFDEQLGGYHLYGADICLQALSRGLDNFSINACLHHKSAGKKLDASFYESISKLVEKWRKQKSPLSVIKTTCCTMQLKSGLRTYILYKLVKRRRRKLRKIERKFRSDS